MKFVKFLVCILLLGTSCLAVTWQTTPLRENGTIQKWLIAGPFPNGEASGSHGKDCTGYFKDYLAAHGGETGVQPGEGTAINNSGLSPSSWLRTSSEGSGLVDFISNLAVDSQTAYVAYAYCQLFSDSEQKALLKVRSNDGVRVWLNGTMVHDRHIGRRVEAEEDRVPVLLRKGENRLLAKVDQSGGAWGLLVSAVTPDGQPLRGVESRIPTDPNISGRIVSAEFQAAPVVVRTAEGDRQIVTAVIRSGGLRETVCTLRKNGWAQPLRIEIGDVTPGTFRCDLKIPVLEEDSRLDILLESASDRKSLEQVLLKKVRPWVVYLVQHTHTDIGYTRPQNEMLAEYFRYIDWALDFCDQTDGYPDDARFRWTCETSWAVREYIQSRPPEQVERLRRRVREGRIEVTGLLLNWSELADESLLAASLQPVRELRRQGIPVVGTMQNDVNGAAWCLVDYFSDSGIRYLSMGINHDHSALQFPRPTPFWWESPSGKRVLAFQADHYMTANAFVSADGNLDVSRLAVISYLSTLEKKQYPFDRIAVQYGGYHTDNSPPAVRGCDLIRRWNEAHVWPRMRVAVAGEFLQYVEKQHGRDLPAHRLGWPDWWTDGVATAARETAAVRGAQAGLTATESAFALARWLGSGLYPGLESQMQSVQDALLFYDEHTYGAAESVTDPDAENSMVQWAQKAAYAWQAVKEGGIAQEAALGQLQPYLPRLEAPSLAVINTLNWNRSALVKVFIDREILSPDQPAVLVDPEGQTAPLRLAGSRAEGSYWIFWARDVPALGYKLYRFRKNSPAPLPAPALPELENEFYKIVLDPATGAVRSLFDKQLAGEWVDAKGPWQLAQFVYEKAVDRSMLTREAFQRSGLKNVRIEPGPAGPIWQSLQVLADAEGCVPTASGRPGGVAMEIRLYSVEKRIELLFAIRKQPVVTPEAVYVLFPFQMPGARIVYEAQGGFITPGKNQISGSSTDYHTVQNFAAVRGADRQLIFCSDQAPMVMFGGFNFGNFGKKEDMSHLGKPHFFSYVLSNYWHTNFPARQEGEIKWSYQLTSDRGVGNTAATRFGWGSRVPLLARVLPPGKKSAEPGARSFLRIAPDNVLLVGARPAHDGRGVILQLREIEGRPAAVAVESLLPGKKISSLEEVNVLQEAIPQRSGTVTLAPYEVKFVRIL